MNKAFQKMLIYFLCFISLVVNTKNALAATISEGDLVKTKTSSSIYLIQDGKKRIFPHSSVYLSWGYPSDYSVVKTVTETEIASFTEGNPVIYRDGFVFRFKGTSMPGGFDPSAVFFVSDGKVRPIESATAYMELLNGGTNDSTIWDKVYWIPKDLLSKFTYEKGENITSAQIRNGQLPNGLVVKTSTGSFGVVKDGKLNEITTEGLFANRYLTNEKIFEKMVAPKIDPLVLAKVGTGGKITNADISLLTVKDLNVTMLPSEDTIGNTDDTGTTSTGNSGSSTTGYTTPVVNTTPLTPTDVVPLSRPSEDPFVLTSVLMKDDSDRVINITFNKEVQNTSAKNKANYTFKKLDGTILNSSTGGARIDNNGHPLVTPVRDSSNNKLVTITLGTSTQDQYAMPAGTYQLCISNMKSATTGAILPTTCKQFNVVNTIKPTLYWNSDSFEFGVNYLASSNKIFIKYSEEMGNSAISASSYKIRDFDSGGVVVSSWIKLSSIPGVVLSFKNNNKDVLISFPSSISLRHLETDFMIGDSTNNSYVPRDISGNLFHETTNNYNYLILSSAYIDSVGINLTDDLISAEILSPTQIAVTFTRGLGYIDVSEFKFKNLANQLGFEATSAEIDADNIKKVIFNIPSNNAFSPSDKSSDLIISLIDDLTSTENTKDIINLPISNYDGSTNLAAFFNKISASISSFVVANPNTIYLKFDNNIHTYSDYYDSIESDLIIEQGDEIYINGLSTSWNASSGEKDGHSYGSMLAFTGGSNLISEYKPGDIVKLIFSPELNMNQGVSIKTVDKDSIRIVGENLMKINENLTGITHSIFAAYKVEKGFFGNLYNGVYGSYNDITLRSLNPQSNYFTFAVEDDDSVLCYSNDFNKDTDYFTANYYNTVNNVAKNITGGFNEGSSIFEYTLSCDINNTEHPLYLGLLKDTIGSYYSSANRVFVMDYPYHYADNTIIADAFTITYQTDSPTIYDGDFSYYTISAGKDNFLSIRFNDNVNLNTLSNGGWDTTDGISYGKTINDSIIFDDINNEITFNGINLGKFKIDGAYSSIGKDSATIIPALDVLYTYNYLTNILTINITDSANNQADDDNTTKIYLIKYQPYERDASLSDGFIRYIPNIQIKDLDGNSINASFTPFLNLKDI